MNYIPTPETDEAELKSIAEYNNPDGVDVVFVCDGYDLARKLERERSEALADLAFRRELYALQTAQLDDMQKDRDQWKAKYIQQNKDLGCELMDPNGTIWEHAQTLQRERDEAREAEASEAKWAALYMAERDAERELADRLAEAVESFLSQPVAPLAPLRESLAAWKEARK